MVNMVFGEVDAYDRSSVADAGRTGYPKVLANFSGENKISHLAAGEEYISSEKRILPAKGYLSSPLECGSKIANLSRARVVGQILLGDNAENLTVLQNSGAVIKLI